VNRAEQEQLKPQASLEELGRIIQQWPYGHDLFRVLRAVDALQAAQGQPRLGTASTPRQEDVRVGQPPSLALRPPVCKPLVGTMNNCIWMCRVFGLWGPNGPLPLHMTEYFFQRSRNFGDRAGVAFLDQFHHRLFFTVFSEPGHKRRQSVTWNMIRMVLHAGWPAWPESGARANRLP